MSATKRSTNLVVSAATAALPLSIIAYLFSGRQWLLAIGISFAAIGFCAALAMKWVREWKADVHNLSPAMRLNASISYVGLAMFVLSGIALVLAGMAGVDFGAQQRLLSLAALVGIGLFAATLLVSLVVAFVRK